MVCESGLEASWQHQVWRFGRPALVPGLILRFPGSSCPEWPFGVSSKHSPALVVFALCHGAEPGSRLVVLRCRRTECGEDLGRLSGLRACRLAWVPDLPFCTLDYFYTV